MKTSVKFSKILAVIIAAMLMLTLLTANVFATDGTGESADVTEEVTGEATGESTEAGDSTEEADDATTAAGDEATTADEHAGHDHDDEDEEESGVNWVDIIVSASILVLGAIAFTVCYFVIPKFREKVKKFFSDYKSELAKVTWSSKEDVRKNTITAIVVIAAVAIVVCLLDVIFSSGIEALSHLVG